MLTDKKKQLLQSPGAPSELLDLLERFERVELFGTFRVFRASSFWSVRIPTTSGTNQLSTLPNCSPVE